MTRTASTVLNEDFDRVGELGPGQSVPVTFVIRAPEKSGIYFPEAWIDVKDGRSTRYPVLVNVNTDIATQKKPSLAIAKTLPAHAAPGDDIAAELTVENTGLTRASDIAIVVNSTVKSIVLTTTGRYYIASLDPGEKSTISLRFASDKNTPSGSTRSPSPSRTTTWTGRPSGRPRRSVSRSREGPRLPSHR